MAPEKPKRGPFEKLRRDYATIKRRREQERFAKKIMKESEAKVKAEKTVVEKKSTPKEKEQLKKSATKEKEQLKASKDEKNPKKEKKISVDKKLEAVAKRAKQKKQRKKRLKNRQLLRKYLDKAGYEEADESKLTKNIFKFIIFACLGLTVVALIVASFGKPGVKQSILFLTGVWTGIFAGLFVLAWVVLYIFLDMRIFNRTMQVEEVLPDFLQLASANISAGMPIDRALWFAVRPRFGILAKEIEDVAKSTVSGEDLKTALIRFTDKYDSKVLKRSINLLLEGMDAGGEMAELLNKVSMNIQETRIIKKEMAANVMTYAIFIGFAAIAAAPILFGLSGQLLIIIQSIMGMMAESGGGGGGMMALSLSGDAISVKDFRIFSTATLFVTAMFSSFIIGIIRKGNIRDGLKYLPLSIAASLVLYFTSSWMLGKLLGGIVG